MVLAFSKTSTLFIDSFRIVDLIDDRYVPCILSIDGLVRVQNRSRIAYLGRVNVVKFTADPFSFRLDIDRFISEDEGINAVQLLLGNDAVPQSYPETLRLAHILSKFTASEVIGVQRFIAENYNLQITRRPDFRQALFGPFCGGSHSDRTVPYVAPLQDRR